MDGGFDNDIITDPNISIGTHLEEDDSPKELDSKQKRRSLLRQKASYLINAHESINISFSNLLSIGTTAFEYLRNDDPTDALDDRLGEDKSYSIAAAIGCSFTFAIAWLLILNKKLENKHYKSKTEYLVDIKHELNPWYRSFKACSSLGNSIGQAATEILFLIPGMTFVPLPAKAALKIFLSGFFGIVFGLIGGLLSPILFGTDDIRTTPNSSIFHIGKDGWGRYAKTGISFGSLIGSAIGAIIGFISPIPGGMAAGMAIGGSIGGIIGFFVMAGMVPFVNYLINLISPPTPEEEKQTIKDNPYRTKYMRTGLAFGVYLGTVVGFILGICFPFPGATVLFMAVCSAFFAIVSAVAFAILGPRISNWLSSKDLSYSSFDFGAGTGGMGLQLISNIAGAACTFAGVAIEKLGDLICAIGGVVGSIIGGIYDGYQARKSSNEADAQDAAFEKELIEKLKSSHLFEREAAEKSYRDEYKTKKRKSFEENQPLIPWSQRGGVFLTYGSAIGNMIGALLAKVFGGPSGASASMGQGAGALISAVVSTTLGTKIYAGYVKTSDWISNRFGIPTKTVTTPTTKMSPTKGSPLLTRSRNNSTTNLLDGMATTVTKEEVPPPLTPPPPPPPFIVENNKTEILTNITHSLSTYSLGMRPTY